MQPGDYPSSSKRTIITPIFKDGRKAKISIYRIIASLLNIFGFCLQKCLQIYPQAYTKEVIGTSMGV